MHDTNLLEAFASYKVKPTRRSRSAMTPEGAIVMTCRYAGFEKADVDTLKYEEDLAGQEGEIASAFRVQLAEALSKESEVRVIVAVATSTPKAVDGTSSVRTTYYARKDLVGRLASFDGQRFVVEFRRPQAASRKAAKGALFARRAG